MTRQSPGENQLDLFSIDPGSQLRHRTDSHWWPDQDRFPVNTARRRVRHPVFDDLVASARPVVVTGYSSIAELVTLIADWDAADHGEELRVVLGTEPFGSSRKSFADPEIAFTEEVEEYWRRQGISVHLSAQILVAIHAVQDERVRVRFVHGAVPLHAKVYVGDEAATSGSSNFTMSGLDSQLEVNARFTRADDGERFHELGAIAENFWELGQDWTRQFLDLLEELLRVTTWQEALSRACAELLDGDWAAEQLDRLRGERVDLWPSQIRGIAQAMWIIENVGSVLVADATGSGKTRMGAHLVRAVRDRMWSTGRVRREQTVLVCPPAVQEIWIEEATRGRLTIDTISHGRLSRSRDAETERRQVRQAQVLAVDEAHNFLNASSNRTQYLRDNLADHVLLFTATPISRGASDLLDLVALLGPDNFDDATHDVLRRLERRGRFLSDLSPEEADSIRGEVQRFTLRRTKTQMNVLVEQDREAYRHPVTERICRYPEHLATTYGTGETDADAEAAVQIRMIARDLLGLAQLPRRIFLPKSLQHSYTDESWLSLRVRSAAGLAAHHVLAGLRSSRAALHEHLLGTASAAEAFGIRETFKSVGTGATIKKMERLAAKGPPEITLDCELPDWLADDDAWEQACLGELAAYQSIARYLETISDARERTKAAVLTQLASHHERTLAFDRHPVTLAVMRTLLLDTDVDVFVATGQSRRDQRNVRRVFSPDAIPERPAIALCSDAMSEGVNLQGASAVVHLDLPTTLRVAEQRIGRVDRMNSPYDTIEARWPLDGEAFATRANEQLLRRIEESEVLLGRNIPVPDITGGRGSGESDGVVDVAEMQRKLEARLAQPPDDLHDALDPVRGLIEGETAIVHRADYARYSQATHRVMARVAPLRSTRPWAFFAVRSSIRGAPRWMYVTPGPPAECLTDLRLVTERLRTSLADDPESQQLDAAAARWFDRCLDAAADAEFDLMPKRLQRSLRQMSKVVTAWARASQKAGRETEAIRWRALAAMAERRTARTSGADPFAVAEAWLDLVGPVLEDHRATQRRRRYVLLDDVSPRLVQSPFTLGEVEDALAEIPTARPFSNRVSACILGVPSA